MAQGGRIDTHMHVVPPAYAAWLRAKGQHMAGGMPVPDWSVEGALDVMDANGVRASILSVSTPGAHLGDDAEAREIAREVNEFAAGVVKQQPDRFGFHATLTLPDVDGAIAEASHALDTLGADGVVLPASVRNSYLGDPLWDPLMKQLDRRKAVILVHPGALAGPEAPGIPPHAADFLLDTTRAAVSLAKSGCLDRYPDLKIILPHGGGFVPFAAERIARACSPDGTNEPGIERLRRFHYDTTLASSHYALPSLLTFADPGRITYGSDWPYAPKPRGTHFTRLLDTFPMPDAQRDAIDRGNAAKLFPRFA